MAIMYIVKTCCQNLDLHERFVFALLNALHICGYVHL